jgi:hypothetical protein
MANTGTESGERRRSVRLYVRPRYANMWRVAEEIAEAEDVSLSEWVSRAVGQRLDRIAAAEKEYRGE